MTLFTVDDAPVPRPKRPITAGRVVGMVTTALVFVTVVGAGAWGLMNTQRVADQFTVWNFDPSARLQQYIDRSTMAGDGEFLFLASTPAIETPATFDSVCSSREEDVGILGCYLPGAKTIHLFDVTDVRLDGLAEVVASHEMLHAAWDRMTAEDQGALAPLLEAEAARLSGDEKFAARLEFYARTEPGERLNELHSIIGTEIVDISDALESHYAVYFSDRHAVTDLHETSNAVFVEHQRRIEELVAEMDALVAAKDADYAAYNAGYDALGKDVNSFNVRANNGEFSSQSQFNRERNTLIRRQADLDALYLTIDAKVIAYNALIAELASLNAEGADLNRSINIEPPRTPEL